MINTELKQAIINYIFENYNLFNRLNNTTSKFKNYRNRTIEENLKLFNMMKRNYRLDRKYT